MEGGDAPGFYGKLASHGDFVTRRLPPGVAAAWDRWLQAAMQASREQLGPGWLDAYLTGPLWRFALAPGLCDEQAWAGVLMPSVDRVGRHFPLVLAAGVAGALPLAQWLEDADGWFERMEDLALSTLGTGFDFASFDAALAALGPPAAAPAVGFAGAHGWQLPLDGDAGAAAEAVAAAALGGHSVWWTEGSDRVGACVRLFRGLPAPDAFAAMLGAAAG
jgi:type VI secretion system protein ImpM